LLKLWRRWTATVESVAQRRLSRRSADRQAFKTLRNQLLMTLQAHAAEVDGPEREFYFSLEQLILPWVSLLSLAREDPEIVHDLMFQCQYAERILKSRSAGFAGGGWFIAASLALAVVSALLFWVLVSR
jgi:hypothetical protein